MDDRMAFIDVETPNRKNDSICSIAVIETDFRGGVLSRTHMLVNPMDRFDDVNMRIHGITPRDVANAPTFAEAWDELIAHSLSSSLVVAHNATFDLCVLWKACTASGIDTHETTYACTKRMAMGLLPSAASYRLPDVCSELGIGFGRHHDAESDALGCMEVFWRLAKASREGIFPYIDTYWGPCERWRRHSGRSGERHNTRGTQDARGLIELARRVTSDGQVTSDEAAGLLSWMLDHETLSHDPVACRIMDALQESLMDGDVSSLESNDLVGKLRRIIDPTVSPDASVVFSGRTFCLTGSFEHGPKEVVAGHIEGLGGTVVRDVTRKCNYVVVGGCGSDAYAFGSYGGKVKKALSWQEKGVPIKIVRECDVYAD